MVLVGLLLLSLIAVFSALTVYLVRRSHPKT
jgi:hypothetical protein